MVCTRKTPLRTLGLIWLQYIFYPETRQLGLEEVDKLFVKGETRDNLFLLSEKQDLETHEERFDLKAMQSGGVDGRVLV